MSRYAALPKAVALSLPITVGAWTVQAADIIQTAEQDGRFTGFLHMLEAAGMVEVLEGEGPFTVFAPVDEAFGQLPPQKSGSDQQASPRGAMGIEADESVRSAEPARVAVAMTPVSKGAVAELEQVDRQQQAHGAVADRPQAARGEQEARLGRGTEWQDCRSWPRASQAMLKGASELGSLWASFWNEQLTTGMEAMRSLAESDSWDEALKVQNEFTRSSLDRVCSRAVKSTEVTVEMLTSSLVPFQESARRASERMPRPAT
jgi:uncharacterized surface protein with fasciclin (FAS1) repeats